MKLTRKMIDDGKSDRGAWSANQLALLGVSWPPLRGWPERIIGTEIADETYAKFLAIRKRTKGAELFHKNTDAPASFSPQVAFSGDRNLESVKAKMDERAKVGFTKYGVTTERTDIDLLGWLIHLQEEQMDSLLYIEAAIQKLRAQIAGRKLLNEIDPPAESAETFANNLFEQTDRNLA